jgi:type II secretory pathway pseudopilin PulG
MSPVTARPPEAGFTLVEMTVAMLIAMVVLLSGSVAMSATTRATRLELNQGSTTNSALITAQAMQQALAGGWTTGTLGGVSNYCTDGGSSGQNGFPSGNGPFVSASSTSIVFCGFPNNQLISYTYKIYFTGCTASHVCTMAIDQEPGLLCSVCTTVPRFRMAGVSNAVTSSPPGPFSFWTYNASASPQWQQTSTLNQIQAVQIALELTNPSGSGTFVQRMILLPNTLSGGS